MRCEVFHRYGSAKTARKCATVLCQSRAGADYGRGGRRSFRDLDLLRGRRGLRILPPLDGPLFFPADGGRATDVRTVGNGYGSRARGGDPFAVSTVGAMAGLPAADCRERVQYWRRLGWHGRCDADGDGNPVLLLDTLLCIAN